MLASPLRTILAALAVVMAAPGAQATPDSAPSLRWPVGEQANRVVRLSYAAFSRGFHVLDAQADLRLTAAGYSIVLRDHSTGLMGLMVHTDVTTTSTGLFVPGGVQPLHFTSAGFSRGAERTTVLDYADGNPVVAQLTPPEPRRDRVDIGDARGSIDTVSAMADLVHTIGQTGRCDGHALIFDGLRLTRASSLTAGEQPVPPSGRSPYGGTALRCDFVTLEIGGFLHDDDAAKMHRPQHGSAWVGRILAGAPAFPVRIVFQNPKFGLITMVLIKAEQFPPPQNSTALLR